MNTSLRVCVLVLLTLYGSSRHSAANDPWEAWKNGNIDKVASIAQELDAGSERSHLLFLCSLVRGQYDSALDRYAELPASYQRLAELDQPVIDCYLHLGRFDEAAEFAAKRQAGPVDALRLRAANPLKASLDEVTVIPFADHELTDYFPAFAAQLQGKPVTVHVDTGGSFIAMSPDLADEFGIELIDHGQGFHGHRKVKLEFGIAGEFKLGAATLKNVPVIVFPTIKQRVIFGTCVMQQFLSTLDYPSRRLILSPRKNSQLRAEHLAMLPRPRVEIPFYMWGDHYMFARGFVADDDQLNFFMDSGLVALRKINDEPMIQAGFMTSREKYRKWGFTQNEMEQDFFRSDQPIGIGPLTQEGIWFLAGPGGEASGKRTFGGVQMDGLLAHAFVQRYSWTLDFERHQYIFGGTD